MLLLQERVCYQNTAKNVHACDPAIPLVTVYLIKIYYMYLQNICINVFIAAFLVTVKTESN